jgi:hypothetical protein
MRITLLTFLIIQLAFPVNAGTDIVWSPQEEPREHPDLSTNHSGNLNLDLMLAFYGSPVEKSLKVFPNPVKRKDMLHITTSDQGKKKLAFYDITGKVVKILETNRTTFSFSVSDLDSGVYILNVSTPSYEAAKKVIVQ